MVELKISDARVPYAAAIAFMEKRVQAIIDGHADECVWFLQHAPLYTAGTSADMRDMRAGAAFPVYHVGRGGQITYHGPGQRVVYLMLDLKRHGRDIRAFVRKIEAWIIATLARFNITAHTDPSRVGVWVARPELGAARADKIAAIGIRVKKWVSLHGLSINIDPDLTHFDAIVPCGIADQGVTSFAALGACVSMAEVDMILRDEFAAIFGTPIQTR